LHQLNTAARGLPSQKRGPRDSQNPKHRFTSNPSFLSEYAKMNNDKPLSQVKA